LLISPLEIVIEYDIDILRTFCFVLKYPK